MKGYVTLAPYAGIPRNSWLKSALAGPSIGSGQQMLDQNLHSGGHNSMLLHLQNMHPQLGASGQDSEQDQVLL